jgi:N-acetylmuramoyl-L-alanine amidase/FlaG/FlaF family flagellin (archaellin)
MISKPIMKLFGLIFAAALLMTALTRPANAIGPHATTVRQYRADTGAQIPFYTGTVPTGVGVYFEANVTSDEGRTVRMDVELRLLPSTFTGTANYSSSLAASGTRVRTTTATGMAAGNWGWKYRIVDSAGVSTGWQPAGDPDFIVQSSITTPTVATQPATLVTSSSARILGRVMSDGGASILERRLEWGISPNWTDFSSSVTVSGNDFYYNLSGLSPNTTYQYRAWARNSAGWANSSAASFTTANGNYTITVSASPNAGGTVGGGGTFAAGSSRTVTAAANSGYTFANWTEGGNFVSSSSSYNFTLNGNRSLVANFTANPFNYTIAVSASPSAGGSVSGGGTFASGSSRTVTATANSGYTFANWTEGGSVVSSSSSYNFTLNGNRTLVANFSNPSQRLIGIKFGIDPGHGGTETGAVGPNFGLTEKSVNLATALALKNYLEAEGAAVVMTRTTDTTVSLPSRSSLFVNNAVDFAISVHHNGGGASANSTMVFIYCDRSLATRGALASAVAQRLGTSTGVPVSSAPASTSDTLCPGHANWQTAVAGVGQANLHMVREPETQANILSILAEVSFVTNPAEEAKLLDAAYLDANGWAIYAGTADYFGFTPKPRGGGATLTTLSTQPASLVTANSARIWGRIVSDGGAAILERRLEWGISGTWSDFTSSVTVSGNDFYYDLSSLSPNTAYQYRAWARNSAGWAYSSAGYFTTANTVNYTVALSSSPSTAGTLSGGGTVAAGQSVTVVASPNQGYAFVNWTESGTPVSTSASYNFTANANRNLVANFQSDTYPCNRSNPSSGLFVITHGWLLNEEPAQWISDMADVIKNRLGVNLPIYTVRIERVPITISLARLASNNPEIDITQFGGAIVLLDWSDASGGVPCENAVSTTDIGDLAFQHLFGRLHAGHSLIEVPVHLIGHSRGASVISRVAYQMARAGEAWVEHFTALDPHPAGPCDWNNSSFPVYANTIFADDYYRTGEGFNGEAIDGAAITSLNGIVTSGYSSHTDVHTYYHGSIPEDLLPGTQVDGRTILTSWYDDSLSPTRPPRYLTGFAFSRMLPDGLILRPDEGIHPDAFGTGTRQTVPIASGNSALPNIAMDDLYLSGGNYTVHVGDSVPLSYFYQDADSQVTVSFKKDNDTNPFNDPTDSCHQSIGSPRTHSQSPSAMQYSTFSWVPGAGEVGTYYIQAKITDGGYTRYDYLATPITVVANATAPDLTVISAVSAPSQSTASSTITIGYILKNLGDAPSGTFNVRVALGTSAYGTQNRIADFSSSSLTAKEQRTETRMVVIPEAFPPGNYWLTVYTDGPAPGVVAESNEGNNIGSSAPSQITITAPTYTIATAASPLSGGMTSGGGAYTRGANINVQASPSAGYLFVNWMENGAEVSTATSYSFAVSGNRSLTANFTAIPLNYTITVSASPSSGGTASGGGKFAPGNSRTVTATANSGYTFANWTEGGNVVSSSSSYTFTLNANRNLIANFTAIPLNYSITLSASPSAGGAVNGAGTFEAGNSRTVTVTANSGFNFANWTEAGSVVSSSASYTFILNGNRTLVANLDVIPPDTTPLLSRATVSNSHFAFMLTGRVGSNYLVQASSNLLHWLPISTNIVPLNGSVPVTDSFASNHVRRFYRAIPLTNELTQ